MPLVTLTFAEFKRLLRIFFYVTAAILAGIAASRHYWFGSSIVASVLGATGAVAIGTFLTFLVLRHPLENSTFAKLIRRKQIHGVWYGQLRSNFNAVSKKHELVIPIAFVIRQTYLGYSLVSYTANQDGHSYHESLSEDARSGLFVIRYDFELRRLFAGENKLTKGQGELRLESGGSRLAGAYWTNSPTQGDAELTLVQRDCEDVDTFDEVVRLFQLKQQGSRAEDVAA